MKHFVSLLTCLMLSVPLIALPLPEAAATEVRNQVEDEFARLSTEKARYPWRGPDGTSRPEICLTFTNKNATEAMILPTLAPYWVRDSLGHGVFPDVVGEAFVAVPPSGRYVKCWAGETYEDPTDALAHKDPRWLALSALGMAPPGDYRIEWSYYAPGWKVRTLELFVTLDETLKVDPLE